MLHTHLLGRRVQVRHLRDGREMEPIALDNNYDYNYQEYRALHTPRTVFPVSTRSTGYYQEYRALHTLRTVFPVSFTHLFSVYLLLCQSIEF